MLATRALGDNGEGFWPWQVNPSPRRPRSFSGTWARPGLSLCQFLSLPDRTGQTILLVGPIFSSSRRFCLLSARSTMVWFSRGPIFGSLLLCYCSLPTILAQGNNCGTDSRPTACLPDFTGNGGGTFCCSCSPNLACIDARPLTSSPRPLHHLRLPQM